MLLVGRGRHRGRRRGEQRRRGRGARRQRASRRGADGRPDAGDGRPRGDPPDHRRRVAGATRVLILTTFDLDEYVYEALRAGASGFLLKDTLPVDLLNAVRVVAAGDALLAPRITRRLIEEFARRPEPVGGGRCQRRARPAHRPRAGGARARRQGPVERRDRGRAVRQPRHGQDPREPAADEARRPRPRPARDDRLRDRRRATRSRLNESLAPTVTRAATP